MPAAASVPDGAVVRARRSSAARATAVSPARTAASTSSGSTHIDMNGLIGRAVAARAAETASP